MNTHLDGKRTEEIKGEIGEILGRLERLQVEIPASYVICQSNLGMAIESLQNLIQRLFPG